MRNDAVSLLLIDRASIFHEYFVGGPGEQVDGQRYPWGWETVEFADTGLGCRNRAHDRRTARDPRHPFALDAGTPGNPRRWRKRPSASHESRVWTAVTRHPPLLQGKGAWTVPPRSTVTLLLDRGHLTTAYPELVTTGGRGAAITLTYTEAARAKAPDGKKGEKGNRNEIEGKAVAGLRDRFVTDGGRGRLFRPLWWRTFRYVEVAVQTADEALAIDDIRALFSAYPFEERGRFESSDPVLGKIWEVGWRTARVCAHETYMDTPVLGAAAVRRRHPHPGPALVVRRRRRPAREERHRAVRRVPSARRAHPEPLPDDAAADHSAVLACSGSG